MLLTTIVVGPLEVNCYVVGCPKTKHVFIIDPGDDPEHILSVIRQKQFLPKAIINTHAHIDHVGAVSDIQKTWDIPYYIHAHDLNLLQALEIQKQQFGLYLSGIPKVDMVLSDRQRLTIGECQLAVIHTPGHSPGSICIMGEGWLLSGDTLFSGSIGRTDLPGGDMNEILTSIHSRLLVLDDDIAVYPGHGPATSIRQERHHNPFLS